MLSYLPGYYDGSVVMQDLLQARGVELDSLRAAIEQILNEFYVDTASDRGLDRWEDELDLPRGDALTLEQRRERLKSRLRGYGTANKAKVKEVTEAFVYGTVAVYDVNDNPGAALPNYTVRIEFISTLGIPSNLVDVQNAVRAIVPSHLAIEYKFNWTTWSEIDAFGRTWDQWDTADAGFPHTWDEMEVLA